MKIPQPARFPIHRLPAQRRSMAMQDEGRLSCLRSHLETITQADEYLQEVAALPHGNGESWNSAAPTDHDRSLDDACQSACALCRGDCCLEGGKRMAFLSAETIRRVRGVRPQATSTDLVAECLSFVPRVATEGGCYFQGRQGCALPRDLRSDICNRYYCDAMLKFRAHSPSTTTEDSEHRVRAFFVVARPDGRRQVRFHESRTI